jgi:hypothetical protein
MRRDFAMLSDVPGDAYGFLSALRKVGPELRALGVSLTIYDSGLIRVQSVAAADKERDEESSLRAAFNGPLPEAAALREEFGSFERFYAYKRGLSAGRINPPIRGRNAINDGKNNGTHAQVDLRLPIEERCRARWNLEPETKREFSSYAAFEAFERANANGQIRRLAPGA